MIKERQFEEEYKIVTPIQQPYAKMPSTKKAERDWWRDYYRRNPTLFMKLVKKLQTPHLVN